MRSLSDYDGGFFLGVCVRRGVGRGEGGFTLLEILMVLMLIVFLSSISMVAVNSLNRANMLNKVAGDMQGIIDNARTLALSMNTRTRVAVADSKDSLGTPELVVASIYDATNEPNTDPGRAVDWPFINKPRVFRGVAIDVGDNFSSDETFTFTRSIGDSQGSGPIRFNTIIEFNNQGEAFTTDANAPERRVRMTLREGLPSGAISKSPNALVLDLYGLTGRLSIKKPDEIKTEN